MKKTKRKAPVLTSKATDDEIIRWTKSHDVFGRLETGVSDVVEDHGDLDRALREAIFQDNMAQLNMRLPVDLIANRPQERLCLILGLLPQFWSSPFC